MTVYVLKNGPSWNCLNFLFVLEVNVIKDTGNIVSKVLCILLFAHSLVVCCETSN